MTIKGAVKPISQKDYGFFIGYEYEDSWLFKCKRLETVVGVFNKSQKNFFIGKRTSGCFLNHELIQFGQIVEEFENRA